jgi:RimJ/RimL family protein N-acetyltransferase
MAFSARGICEDDLDLIARWRMDPDITRWMNTDPVLTHDGQVEWLNRISADECGEYWMLEVDGEPAGLLQLFDIDLELGVAEWGYFIGERKLRSMAFAIAIEMSLYSHCFEDLGLNRVINGVHADNIGTIKLHELCGNRVVGVRKHAGEKNGIPYDIVDMEIDRPSWNAISSRAYERIEL